MPRCLLALSLACSLVLPHALATAQDRWNMFFIGHSLMSDLPGMTKSLLESRRSQRMGLRHQDVAGAPLRWQWKAATRNEEFERSYAVRYDLHLVKGDFDSLVLTEGCSVAVRRKKPRPSSTWGVFWSWRVATALTSGSSMAKPGRT